MEDVRSERIVKAEEGLAEMQEVLDHAKRAVDAADRAEQAAHDASDHARSIARITVIVAGVVIALMMTGAAFRRRG
jgi:DNA-binding transcriptional LysR family regulator